jgi:peptidylprolyl isomerase
MLRTVALVVLLIAVMAVLAGCPKPAPEPQTIVTPPEGPSTKDAPKAEPPPADKPAADKPAADKSESKVKVEGEDGKPVKKTDSGLEYVVLDEGKGEKPKQGDKIQAEYTGWLTDGKKFDSSKDHPEAFEFAVGTGEVIPAWDEALSDMKVGERRKLIVPPKLGYGERGTPGGPIPPNATLIFEVKLVKIVK